VKLNQVNPAYNMRNAGINANKNDTENDGITTNAGIIITEL
jgi:hypothetical protein